MSLIWLGESDGEELAEAEVKDDSDVKRRKQLGIPEVDPDALPSSQAQKYLNLYIVQKSTLFVVRRPTISSRSLRDENRPQQM